MKFKPGDHVRVKGHREIAVIERLYPDIPGGIILDREIGGFRSWNVKYLVKVRAKTARGRA